MARFIPIIRAGVLIITPHADGNRDEVPAESDAWFRWLESARTFAFEDASGHFTARKKRRWSADYWYAFRRGRDRPYETYLGKARDITLGRLHAIAAKLSQRIARTPEMPTEAPADLRSWRLRETLTTRPHLSIAEPHAPDPRSSLFIRTSAVERLAKAVMECALTVVSAPAGFGKTTLLSQVIETLRLPTASLSLTEHDNDPIHFWTRVTDALNLAVPGLLDTASLCVGDDRARSVDVMLPAVTAALSRAPTPILLVLDDYHMLRPDNHARHTAITNLVRRLSPHVHLALASRTMPPLPLAALRELHRILELRATDLQFTRAETRAFLNRHVELGLSDEEITMLHARTEGWVAALQLAALSLREQANPREWVAAFNGENRHIFEYLVEEVIKHMPSHLYTFALPISPLYRLSGSLCDAVTRSEHGQELLEEMERANLFITPLGDPRGWYRLHPLFAEAMRRRLRQRYPGLEPRIYARAGAWCETHGLALDTMDYAFAASELEVAHTAELVAAYIPSALASGDIALLRDRGMRNGDATAYVCMEYACQTPVTAAADLGRQLEDAVRAVSPGALPTT